MTGMTDDRNELIILTDEDFEIDTDEKGWNDDL